MTCLPGLDARVRGLELTVYGTPAPQGSKRGTSRCGQDARFCPHCKRTHLVRVDMRESSKHVGPWRALVVAGVEAATTTAGWAPLDGPIAAAVVFTLPRPAGHWGTGRNAGRLRPSAPAVPAGYPDTSKLLRAVEDALTDGGAIADDARIWRYDAIAKVYPADPTEPRALDRPGVWVRLRETDLRGE